MRRFTLAVAVLVVLVGVPAAAQTVSVQGGRFAVDGRARFLVFVSYFDGVRRIPDSLSTMALDRDLDDLAGKGVGGLRVFPNWQFPNETLMDASGALRPLQLAKLERLIDRAAAKGLVVDLSFTHDTVPALTMPGYKHGLESVTRALVGKANVFFDLQNELDRHVRPAGPPHSAPPDLQRWRAFLGRDIRSGVKAIDPARLVTVSWTSDRSPSEVAANVQEYAYDILAYHHRTPTWVTDTTRYVLTLNAAFAAVPPVRPIYIQEPGRRGHDDIPAAASDFSAAVVNARRAGAAGWTLHIPKTDLNNATPFRDLLGPAERTFLDGLRELLNRP